MEKMAWKDKTIKELKAEAEKLGVPLLRSMKKKDILRALEKRKRLRRSLLGKTALSAQRTTGVKKGKEGIKRKSATNISSAGKPEASTPKKSKVTTPSVTLKKKTVINKTMKGVTLPARGKKVPVRPLANTATKASSSSLLPSGYGENDLFLIVVDPEVVYASWEIRPEDPRGRRRGLRMRLFDVTAAGPNGRSDDFVDIGIAGRVGSGFFNIMMPGRDVVAEVGVVKSGTFQPILRSNMVSFPLPLLYCEFWTRESPESGTPIGY
jgi:hypothetical protein